MLNNSQLSNNKIRQLSTTPNPKSYQEFLDALYCDLDFAIKELAKYKNICSQGIKNNPTQGENLINVIICVILTARGWQAGHDTSINGHADIVVTLPYMSYQWISEGKIYSGPTYTTKGLNQLAYRYSTGLEGQNAGGLLIYIDSTNLNQKQILDKWSKSLQDSCFPIIKPNSPCANNSLAFYSTHTHPSSGLDYTIRHMTLDFRHSPKD
ncbi:MULTISPECIES: hypothetical protein [Moraxella]|uniref:Uncharacterized protein n=1 Tax=Moraxella catarrhalis TaxID=480 RepID=A0A7Z1A314_MORCA|nr:hypothetical protein [Moraxella catarrhalis]OAU99267.1 hypothetical protein AO382_2110 [Moraxella catarrhalis]STY81715.1 Uncharacterised protein [Moraxella catarrhalis]